MQAEELLLEMWGDPCAGGPPRAPPPERPSAPGELGAGGRELRLLGEGGGGAEEDPKALSPFPSEWGHDGHLNYGPGADEMILDSCIWRIGSLRRQRSPGVTPELRVAEIRFLRRSRSLGVLFCRPPQDPPPGDDLPPSVSSAVIY
uniref:Uncharacterized protein n=1 Tax=Sphaerodactylus townsendi TaxID=933632 RepID=A0ACB8EUK8_9SAUR